MNPLPQVVAARNRPGRKSGKDFAVECVPAALSICQAHGADDAAVVLGYLWELGDRRSALRSAGKAHQTTQLDQWSDIVERARRTRYCWGCYHA
jgi:hypothetical protein